MQTMVESHFSLINALPLTNHLIFHVTTLAPSKMEKGIGAQAELRDGVYLEGLLGTCGGQP